MSSVITWCNNNSGFVMAVLTFVYVIATIFIYRANKKSVNAMRAANMHSNDLYEQNRSIQKQNVNLQLFDARYDLYEKIKDYLNSRNSIIRNIRQILNNQQVVSNIEFSHEFFKIKYLFNYRCFDEFFCLETNVKYIYDLSIKIFKLTISKIENYDDFLTEINKYYDITKKKSQYENEEEFIKKCFDTYFKDYEDQESISFKFYKMIKDYFNLKKEYDEDLKYYIEKIESFLDY